MQGKLKEIFEKQYKLTTWVEVQTRYKTVVMVDPFTLMPYTVQVPYEYKIFHTKLENKGLEVVIREELTEDQWRRYEISKTPRAADRTCSMVACPQVVRMAPAKLALTTPSRQRH